MSPLFNTRRQVQHQASIRASFNWILFKISAVFLIDTAAMSVFRLAPRFVRPSAFSSSLTARAFGTSSIRSKDLNDRAPSTAPEHREHQTSKPLNQHIPNTTSTQTNDFPKVGEKSSPPDLLKSVDPNYKPADPYAGRVEHFTGGLQQRGPQKPELEVGEMEGITFKVEPLRREGEDPSTMRARLLCG